MGLMGGAAKSKGKGRVELGVELGKGEVVNGLERLEVSLVNRVLQDPAEPSALLDLRFYSTTLA
jgi:hypothetical protein